MVERSCAHLTGVVKSNSSGIEVWSGPAQDQEILDRGAVDSWNPPQRGLGVTGKSSTPPDKFMLFLSLDGFAT